MSAEIEKIARSNMRSPKLVEVNPRGRAAGTVEQTAYPVAIESKTALLLDLLERERYERVLVFTRTRRGAERLSHILEARSHKVNRIHADRSQPQREAALRGFKEGRTRVLVATDIAARGIDVDSITHVINYDVPAAPEDYVHRIGRDIERLTGQSIERVRSDAFGIKQPTTVSSVKKYAPMRGAGATGRRSFRPRRAR
jgi:ATP-dependent RNA helicase RhlE